MDSNISISRSSPYPSGRLIILSSGDDLSNPASTLGSITVNTKDGTDATGGANVIEFPAMPDTIEISRSAEYLATSNWVMPDGVHMYKSTSILNIPFSFQLHAFDSKYCPNGPATIAMVGARLQALVIPIGDQAAVPTATNTSPVNNEASKNNPNNGETTTNQSEPTISYDYSNVDPPVTVRLELMSTGDGPGIACNGYIKDVSYKPRGPWLVGQKDASGRIPYNLPSSAEYSFTFVFHPSHSNFYSRLKDSNDATAVQQLQAYATYVRQNMYDQSKLGSANGADFKSY